MNFHQRHPDESRGPQQKGWIRAFAGMTVVLIIMLVVGSSRPALAQEQDDTAQKRALVLQFFEAKPPRALVEASIEGIAAARYAADDPAREEFVSRMQLAVDYDQIEVLTLQSMMDLYTVDELSAMVAYYTSEAGRSAEAKATDLRAKIAPELKKMLDQGVLNVVTTPTPAESAQGR